MPWPWLLTGVTVLLLLAFLLMPVRIFARYLRENNNVRFTATIKAGPLVYRIAGMPAWIRSPIGLQPDELLSFRGLSRLRPLTRKITLTRLMVELSFGTGDPGQTGFLTGLSWGALSILLGSFCRFLRCRATPKFTVVPVFNRPYFKVRWEGDFYLPLHGWLRLILALIKAEVLTVGKPSH